ncbi:MAG: hypothetical protein JO368_02475 [Acidimicrobiales bacterium]|nr:hypothetical protein [Acidimicrobiales bacterium]
MRSLLGTIVAAVTLATASALTVATAPAAGAGQAAAEPVCNLVGHGTASDCIRHMHLDSQET